MGTENTRERIGASRGRLLIEMRRRPMTHSERGAKLNRQTDSLPDLATREDTGMGRLVY
jgi:hypothetical protein